MFILPAIQEHQGMGQSKWHMWIFVSLRTPRKCSWNLSCLHLSGINVVNLFQHSSSHSGAHFENCYSQIFFILQWNIGAPLCHWTQVSIVGAKMGILPKPALTPPSYTGTSDIFSSRGPWSMKLCHGFSEEHAQLPFNDIWQETKMQISLKRCHVRGWNNLIEPWVHTALPCKLGS